MTEKQKERLKSHTHVAFVHRYLGLGGAEQVSLQTSVLFKQLGIKSTFFIQKNQEERYKTSDGLSLNILMLPVRYHLWTKSNVDYIIAQAKEQHISVIIIPFTTHNPYIERLKAAGLKIIIWCHNVPLWEIDNWMQVPSVRNVKTVSKWLNYWLIRYPLEKLFCLKERSVTKAYVNLLRHCDRFITLCPEYTQEIKKKLGLGTSLASKIIDIKNPVIIPESVNRAKDKLIVFMGRLSFSHKHPERILDIWERIQTKLPDWSLEIYGEGEESKHIQQEIKERNLQRISLKGYSSSPSSVYARASILLLTSSFEGWPLVLAEAQCSATIPIAFDVTAGIRSIIRSDKECGRLVTPFDIEEYANKLYELCSDEELRTQVQGRCIVQKEQYATKSILASWEKLLSELSLEL